MCPTPRISTLRASQVGVVDAGRALRARSSGPGRSRRRGTGSGSRAPARAARRPASLSGRSWRASGCGTRWAGRVPACGRAEGHQGVHPLVAAEPLHVVARDQAAHAVADDVDALEAGLVAELLDPGGEARRRRAGRRWSAGCSSSSARGRKPRRRRPRRSTREDRAVVDHAVHQQDRRPGRLDVADQQTALHRREPGEVARLVPRAPARSASHAERVERGVRRDPGDLDGGAAQAGRGQQAAGAATQRRRRPARSASRTRDPFSSSVTSRSPATRSRATVTPDLPRHRPHGRARDRLGYAAGA